MLSIFSGNKDVDRLILMNLESDRDVLNACSVNTYTKSVCNDDFFRNRLAEKYPKSISFRTFGTWKNYYLMLIYYKSKMEENHGFNFIDGNAKLYYNILETHDFIESLTNGLLDLLIYYLEILNIDYKEIDARLDYNMLMAMAAENGHKNIVDYFITKGADNFNQAMTFSIKGNHNDLAYFFISKGADNWNQGLAVAAETGDLSLINYFIKKGATKNSGLKGAARGGKLNLVRFFINEGAKDIDTALLFAVRGFEEHPKESIDVIIYLIRLDADAYIGLEEATKLKNEKLIKYFSEVLANEFYDD